MRKANVIDSDDDQLVHLAVPYRYLGHVSALLAELENEDKQSRRPARPAKIYPPELGGDWPQAELRRFAGGRTKSHATIVRVLDLLAEQPGERMSAVSICEATGMPMNALKGAFAGLTRLVKAHFDYSELRLPVNRHTRPSSDGEGETVYWLTGKQARQWRLARGAPDNRG